MRKLGPASQWLFAVFIAGSLFAAGYMMGTSRDDARWQRLAAQADDLQQQAARINAWMERSVEDVRPHDESLPESIPSCGTGVYTHRVVPEINIPATVPSMWFQLPNGDRWFTVSPRCPPGADSKTP
jgi:hypothetical protein